MKNRISVLQLSLIVGVLHAQTGRETWEYPIVKESEEWKRMPYDNFSETDFTDRLETTGKRKLAGIILQNHQSKKAYPEHFIGVPYNSSLKALLKILESDKRLPANGDLSFEKFREKTGNERYQDKETESIIIAQINEFLNGR